METAYEARVETLAGMQNSSNSSSDNTKYSNGIATGSYGSMGGEYYLGTINISAPSPETQARAYNALMTDMAGLAYTVFTFTPLGDIYDTISQYGNGELGGVKFVGMLGLAFVPGGKIAKTLMKSKYFGVGSRLFGHSALRGGKPGLFNKPGSLLKVGWSSTSANGGGWALRLGRGANGNKSIKHDDIPGLFVPNEVANPIIRELMRR